MESERLINFCVPSLQSKISSNTCSSESYEETNLLSSDTAKFRRGFMADRFIKPPVDIVVAFKHPVNLSHIIIWPRVGQQKSSGFEISTSFSERSNYSRSHESKSNEMTLSLECSCERISFCSLSEVNNGVLFYSPKNFRKSDTNLIIQDEMNFAKQPFKWFRQSAITDVKTVTIRITRTLGSSVPALGRIEIWGEPGVRNTPSEKREQWRLWEQTLQEKQLHISSAPPSERPNPKPGTSREPTSTASDINVPEDFLDALTFEIMSVPMVLPSGKVVDQRTLERHQDNEANWGRAPSDPFTGLLFTPSIHPILDNALKSRIDHFLVVHQDREELRSVPRTLGRKKISCGTKSVPENVSSLSSRPDGVEDVSFRITNVSEHKKVLSESASGSCSGRVSPTHVSNDLPVTHKKIPQLSKKSERASPVNLGTNQVFHVGKNTVSSSNIIPEQRSLDESRNERNHCKKRSCSPEIEILSENIVSNKIAKTSNDLRHSRASVSGVQLEPDLAKSSAETRSNKFDDGLDDALKAVLTGLPSFVNVDKRSAMQSTSVRCCKCDVEENLFMLPCDHLICRACLVQSTKSLQPKCFSCNSSYTSSQPVKYHH